MAWSSIAAQQEAFEAAGIDGSVPADGVLVSVVNRGGNKLDWFLDATADLQIDASSGTDRATLTVTLHNGVVPAAEPTYVAGPYEAGLAAGQYLGVVTADHPGHHRECLGRGRRGRGRRKRRRLASSTAPACSSSRAATPPWSSGSTCCRAQRMQLVLQPSGRVHRLEWLTGGQPVADPVIPLRHP